MSDIKDNLEYIISKNKLFHKYFPETYELVELYKCVHIPDNLHSDFVKTVKNNFYNEYEENECALLLVKCKHSKY